MSVVILADLVSYRVLVGGGPSGYAASKEALYSASVIGQVPIKGGEPYWCAWEGWLAVQWGGGGLLEWSGAWGVVLIIREPGGPGGPSPPPRSLGLPFHPPPRES